MITRLCRILSLAALVLVCACEEFQRGYAAVQQRRAWNITTAIVCVGLLVNNGRFAWELQFHQDDLPRLKTVRPGSASI